MGSGCLTGAKGGCLRWHGAEGNGGEAGRYFESSVSELCAPDVVVSEGAQKLLREGRRQMRLHVGGVVIGNMAQRRRECCEQEGWFGS